MKLPINWKNRSKEHKALWFSKGRTGAKKIGDYNGSDFVDAWVPTVRGQIVQCPLTKKSKFGSELDAALAAVRFREMCRNIANTTEHRTTAMNNLGKKENAMPRKKVKKPPVGRCAAPPLVLHESAFLAEQIEAVATLMWAMAERMEYFGGFNGEMVKHSREMAGASILAKGWASAIRKQNTSVTVPPLAADTADELVGRQN